MTRFALILLTVLASGLVVTYGGLAEAIAQEITETDPVNWYPFEPTKDNFAPTATDCSGLIEKPTGKHGFVKVRGDRFVFQDGTPARFWGGQISPWTKEQTDYAVRCLRKRGINMVRMHGLGFLNRRGATTSFEYDSDAFDRLDYILYRCGQEGIYVVLDVDYTFGVRPGDRVAGLERGGTRFLMFFNDKIAEIKRRRMTDIFTHLNPYTNRRYCNDPTLALVEICNEDSLFWHGIDGVPEPFKTQLIEKFKVWLKQKYGTTERLRGAWRADGRDGLGQTEGLGKQEKLEIVGIWEFSERRGKEYPEKVNRGLDQLRFFMDLEQAYWQGSRYHLRKIGVKVPICGTNWKGGGFTTRVHMKTQAELDYIDRHGYWDHPQGEGGDRWRISRCKFFNLPMIKAATAGEDSQQENNVGNLVLSKAWEQVLGMPMSVSEWNTCVSNEYSLEGPGLIAAYGLLQGWDAPLEFGHHSPDWRPKLGPNSFDMLSNPPQLLQYPILARMWHRQDVREAEVVAETLYGPDEIFEFKDDRRPLPMMAACVGKVGYRFVDEPRRPIVKNIDRYWDARTLTARSITGELMWNASDGIMTIDTPRTAGVIGFLSLSDQRTTSATFESSTRFGAVYVTSLDDDKPICSAHRLLVAAIGPARNTGMEYLITDEKSKRHDSNLWRLKNAGDAPILLEAIVGRLTIRTDHADEFNVWALDVNGKRLTQLPVKAEAGQLTINLERKYGTMYYELAMGP